jgi:hypothetical protein
MTSELKKAVRAQNTFARLAAFAKRPSFVIQHSVFGFPIPAFRFLHGSLVTDHWSLSSRF